MIRGVHGLLFSSDADATRAFIRDKLRLPFTDTGGGWLIFDLREGDLGVHSIDESGDPPAGAHQLSLYCDDIRGTVAELKTRGVAFDREIREQQWDSRPSSPYQVGSRCSSSSRGTAKTRRPLPDRDLAAARTDDAVQKLAAAAQGIPESDAAQKRRTWSLPAGCWATLIWPRWRYDSAGGGQSRQG